MNYDVPYQLQHWHLFTTMSISRNMSSGNSTSGSLVNNDIGLPYCSACARGGILVGIWHYSALVYRLYIFGSLSTVPVPNNCRLATATELCREIHDQQGKWVDCWTLQWRWVARGISKELEE